MAHETDAPERILVLGIGNILMKDEGVGCRVVEELFARYEFPDNVDIDDSGTMGMMILNLLRQYDFVLIVDAVNGTGYPGGSVVRLAPEDIANNQVMHSLHDLRFVDVLQAAELIGIRPEGHVVGIQVEDMEPVELTIGLSEPVEAALDTAIDAVLTVLAERGVKVTAKV
ncbi:MAG: HyaD/HybD family hydrogenase maturation endopeptidase [Actinobacteria bacterium]|nr:HyaD/HybD family hydrogenase maturation endopeptidase [Actinomycetota bacterium]MCG2807691.1 HyaD/HybD family hydrogenase maturation endopeptidase [Coriobacteriia bacterium]